MCLKNILIVIFFISACSRHNDTIYVENTDYKSTISIITKGSIRYIINGEYNYVPDSNFIKVNIENMNRDQDFAVCWNQEGYKWKMVNDGAESIDNVLDSKIFHFSEEYNRDERGIPTMRGYIGKDCAQFSLYNNLGVYLGFEKGYSIYKGRIKIFR